MHKSETVTRVQAALKRIEREFAEAQEYLATAEETLGLVASEEGAFRDFALERVEHFISRCEELLAQREFTQRFLDIKKAEAGMPSHFLS